MPDDPLQVRANSSTGEAMMNVALALMRDVKEEVGRMNDKLDEIAKERRDEAREHGGLEVRVAGLESAHLRHVKVVCTLFIAIAGALILSKLQLK